MSGFIDSFEELQNYLHLPSDGNGGYIIPEYDFSQKPVTPTDPALLEAYNKLKELHLI